MENNLKKSNQKMKKTRLALLFKMLGFASIITLVPIIVNTSTSNSQNDNLLSSLKSNKISKSNLKTENPKTAFLGTTLSAADVAALGWDTKENITLEDWKTSAPNVTRINGAFYMNKTLKTIAIPSTVTLIDVNAFASSVLTEITIPDTVTGIAANSFDKTNETLAGNKINLPIQFKGGIDDYNNRKYGFDAEQWNSIIWTNIQVFQGNTLTKIDVIKLNWEKQLILQLRDFTALAPNVTTINGAFAGNLHLIEIIIPSKVTVIHNFVDAKNLKTVIFENNSQLTTIGIPAVGGEVFAGTSINEINIPNSVTTIGDIAFTNTSVLEGSKVQMSSVLKGTTLDYYLTPKYGFTKSQWGSINWRAQEVTTDILTVEELLKLNWENKIAITLEDWAQLAPNVTTINGAFWDNKYLETIEFPSTITTLGPNAFNASIIKELVIPNSITNISDNAFANTENTLLGQNVSIDINFKGISNPTAPKYGFVSKQWIAINWTVTKFMGDTLTANDFFLLNWENQADITLADWAQWAPNVTIINGAFKNSTQLNTIQLPEILTTIGPEAFSGSSITSIQLVASTNPQLTSISENAFTNTTKLINIIADVKWKSLSANPIPGSTYPPLYGFSAVQWNSVNWKYKSITSTECKDTDLFWIGWDTKEVITLQDWAISAPNVTIINGAFMNDTYLKTIELPSTIVTIGANSFNGSGLTSLNISSQNNPNLTTISDSAFLNTSTTLLGQNIVLPIEFKAGKMNDYLPKYGFDANQWNAIDWILKTIFVETLTLNDVKELNWENKTDITLADWAQWAPNIKSIGAAFKENKFLKIMNIPATVNTIDAYAFAYSDLTTIIVPPTVIYIRDSAFLGTNLTLKNITLPSTLKPENLDFADFGFNLVQWNSIKWVEPPKSIVGETVLIVLIVVLSISLLTSGFFVIKKIKKS